MYPSQPRPDSDTHLHSSHVSTPRAWHSSAAQIGEDAHRSFTAGREDDESGTGELHLREPELRFLETEPSEPPRGRAGVLRIVGRCVEHKEPERVRKREVRRLAGRQLGEAKRAGLDRAAVAGERRARRGHEQMFARLPNETGGQANRGGGTRTPDLRFWRPPLYQLSYAPRLEGRIVALLS
jgi:hypothetical protein